MQTFPWMLFISQFLSILYFLLTTAPIAFCSAFHIDLASFDMLLVRCDGSHQRQLDRENSNLPWKSLCFNRESLKKVFLFSFKLIGTTFWPIPSITQGRFEFFGKSSTMETVMTTFVMSVGLLDSEHIESNNL